MTWHLSHRPTRLHHAVSAAMLCAIGTAVSLPAANAATLGKTTITSSQHEPLVAVISVTDIEASNFSASLASPALYQQLGLSPTDSMSLSFVPTSQTSGQMILSTTQPISKPFTDIVLAIKDKGKRNIIPKTLLMPLERRAPIKAANRSSQNQIIATAAKPNLPVISASETKPLALKRGAPPPLMAPSSPQLASSDAINNTTEALEPNINRPVLAATTELPTTQATITSSTSAPPTQLSHRSTTTDSIVAKAQTLNTAAPKRSTATSLPTNKQQNLLAQSLSQNDILEQQSALDAPVLDTDAITAQTLNGDVLTNDTANNDTINNSTINNDTINNDLVDSNSLKNNTLNIQVTRQIIVRNSPINKVDSTNSPTLALTFDERIDALETAQIKAKKANAANALVAKTVASEQTNTVDTQTASTQASDVQTAKKQTNNSDATYDTAQSDRQDDKKTGTYTVQRNDNLWIISQQIAKQNNLKISAVMRQIKAQNPDAFINQDASQLKANAQLILPNYEVVPSQSSIQTAIAAQRARTLQASRAKAKPLNKAQAAKAISEPANTTAKTITQALPQARFSVIAPTQKGKAVKNFKKSYILGAPGWFSQLSVCLWLRS